MDDIIYAALFIKTKHILYILICSFYFSLILNMSNFQFRNSLCVLSTCVWARNICQHCVRGAGGFCPSVFSLSEWSPDCSFILNRQIWWWLSIISSYTWHKRKRSIFFKMSSYTSDALGESRINMKVC